MKRLIATNLNTYIHKELVDAAIEICAAAVYVIHNDNQVRRALQHNLTLGLLDHFETVPFGLTADALNEIIENYVSDYRSKHNFPKGGALENASAQDIAEEIKNHYWKIDPSLLPDKYLQEEIEDLAKSLKEIPSPTLALQIADLLKQVVLHGNNVAFVYDFSSDFIDRIYEEIQLVMPEEATALIHLITSQMRIRKAELVGSSQEYTETCVLRYLRRLSSKFVSDELSRWSPALRPRKEETRHLIATNTIGPKKSLLLMPGDSGRDVQLLLFSGIGNFDSSWVLADKNATVLEQVKEREIFPRTARNIKWHTGHYHNIHFGTNHEPIDFAWLDKLGNLLPKDLLWLEQEFLPNCDIDNLDVWFTFYYYPRGNRFIMICRELLLQHQDYLDNELRKVHTYNLNHKFLDGILVQWELLKYVFNRYHFNSSAWLYSDKHHAGYMVLFHLSNFTRRGKPHGGVSIIKRAITRYQRRT